MTNTDNEKKKLTLESNDGAISCISAPSLYSAMLAFTAIGEVIGKIKKQIYDNEDIDLKALVYDIERASDSLQDLHADVNNGNIKNINLNEMFEGSDGYFTEVGSQQLADVNPRLLHVVLSIATEGAAVLEVITNQIEGRQFDVVNLTEKIGKLNSHTKEFLSDAPSQS